MPVTKYPLPGLSILVGMVEVEVESWKFAVMRTLCIG